MPFPRFAFYRDNSTIFSYAVAEQADLGIWIDSDPSPEHAILVSANYFADLGINPVQGRLLDRQDDVPRAAPAAVLASAFWRRRLGGDPAMVGRLVSVNGKPVLVGIVPDDFQGLSGQVRKKPAVWFSIAARPYLFAGSKALNDLSQRDTTVYAKLKPGITFASAEAQLASLTAELRRQYPNQVPPENSCTPGRLRRSRQTPWVPFRWSPEWSFWFSLPPVPTWGICCWREAKLVSMRSTSALRWGPAERGLCDS